MSVDPAGEAESNRPGAQRHWVDPFCGVTLNAKQAVHWVELKVEYVSGPQGSQRKPGP